MTSVMGNKLVLMMALIMSCVVATTVAKEVPPTPNRLVNDYAKVLSASDVQRLEQKLVQYDEQTSTQIAVVIIQSLEGDDMFDYSQRLAETWGIGGAENDNGVLLIVSIDDRKLRIHTGYGTEGAIPDATAKQIIEDEIKPGFKAGDYYAGIDRGTDAMIAALKGEYTAAPKKRKRGFPFGLIPVILIIILASIFGRRRRYTGYGSSGRRYYGTPWIGGFGGGSSGGDFGGGGGFGGFGGGGFGGGGAGGSW